MVSLLPSKRKTFRSQSFAKKAYKDQSCHITKDNKLMSLQKVILNEILDTAANRNTTNLMFQIKLKLI